MDARQDAGRNALCRDCANFKGMRIGPERRRASARLCAAGIEARADPLQCESYVPLLPFARTFAMEERRRPS